MQKIKNVLSHGSRKSVDASNEGDTPGRASTGGLSGQGSHLEGAQKGTSTTATGDNDFHPIYDQFTGRSRPTSEEPTSPPTTHQSPQSANTSTLDNPPDSAKEFGFSSPHRPGNMSEGMSTASIKSGVLGFPQSGEEHAARQISPSERGLDTTEGEGAAGLPDRTVTGQQQEPSHLERDAALGAGTVGAGTAGAHELHRTRDHDNLRAPEQSNTSSTDPTLAQSTGKDFAQPSQPTSQQPFEQSFQEPHLTTDTDRSFPLAGGVTSRKQADLSSTHDTQSKVPVTSEREPGTKDKNVGFSESHGREALAGAAAAAAASSSSRPTQSELDRQHDTPRTTGATSGAPVTSASELRAEHELRSGHNEPQQTDHNREALAGATAATVASSAIPTHSERDRQYDTPRTANATSGASVNPAHETQAERELRPSHHEPQQPNHNRDALAGATAAATAASARSRTENDHQSSIDPCDESTPSARMFTTGPHATDTANRLDPHLHVPGEFPETPMETPGERGQGNAGYISGSSRQPEARAVEPSTQSPPGSQHHYGRDAALAGGLGAAGVGAYEAGKHHDEEPSALGGEAMPTQPSPYSSKKLDPRLDGKTGALEEQRFDPTTRTEPASLSGTTPATQRETTQTGIDPVAHSETKQPLSETQDLPSEKDHHFGRDAGIAGAGAATAGGLYYASQHDEKPDSGPASATIGPHKSNVLNVLDPRVQPDPTYQKHHQAGPTAEDPATATVGPHKSNVANVLDPRVHPQPEKQKGHKTTGLDESNSQPQDQHHYGRDAAVVGGTGVAGYGAHEAAKDYDQHRSTQPEASLNEQRYDPTAHGTHDQNQTHQHHHGRDAALVGGTSVAGYGANEAVKGRDQQLGAQPATGMDEQRYDPTAPGAHDPNQTSQHHYGRDAAVVGGTSAVGYGAYEATKGHGQHGTAQPATLTNEQRYDPTTQGAHVTNQTQQHHYGRDAAVSGGVAGAGALAYEGSKRGEEAAPAGATQHYTPGQTEAQPSTYGGNVQPTSHQHYDSNEDPHQQHQGRDAAAAGTVAGVAGAGAGYAYSQHEAKDAEKERLAHQKAEQKELEHQQKEQQKEFEKKQKEQEKAFQHQQKDIEKQQAHDQKQHNKLVAAENKAHQKEIDKEQARQQKEAERAEDKDEGKEKKHGLFGFLHRDKSKKEKASPEGSPRHSADYAAVGAGTTAAAYAEHEGRNKLHKDPPKGHPAREALEGGGKHEHVGTDGPIGRSDEISGDYETQKGVYGAHPIDDQQHTVTEPHTGLPMNVDKYGDGQGGTDGSTTVGGYHQVPGTEQQGSGQHGVTDWNAIKKADTPY